MPAWAIGVSVLCLLLVGVIVGGMMSSSTSTPAEQAANLPANELQPRQNNAHPPLPNQVQFTAVEQAEIDRFLGEYGTDLRAVRNVGRTITDRTMLHFAVQHGTLAVVRYLVSQGLSVHARDSNRATPLHLVYSNNNVSERIKIAEFLISQGADVNAENRNGRTALYMTAHSSMDIELVKFLVSQGANVNSSQSWIEGPLHGAVRYGRLEIVKFLVSQGADVNADAHNADGPTLTSPYGSRNTPIDIARINVRIAQNANERARAEAVLAALEGR